MLKELQKYKLKKPKDIEEIKDVYEYVRVKTNNLCI